MSTILFACRNFNNIAGGIERMASIIMNEMVRRGHKVILLTCSEEVQKFRVLKREGWNDKRLTLTKKKQLIDRKKKKLADAVINTDRGKRYVFNEITNILNQCYVEKKRPNCKIIFNFKK